ncbi:MAG: hypothetical protein E7172_04755 [Firmicutes bacterium]|nr:hypothetical protein [Bacillota bacterium]
MNENFRKAILIIIPISIFLLVVIGFSQAFMNPIVENEAITTVDIKSCAKVSLVDSESTPINLTKTFPMSDVKGLNTIPYSFEVKSTCESYVGFNLYFTTLETNDLDENNIKYAITLKDTKMILQKGIIGESADGSIDFDSEEIKQLQSGLNGEYKNIYKVFSSSIPNQDKMEYDLYLWIDENAPNETMNSSFSMGISIQSYDREISTIADACIGLNMAECIKENYELDETIIYHDGEGSYENAELEAGDNSYRYSGGDYKIADEYSDEYSDLVDRSASTDVGVIRLYCSNEEESYVGSYCYSNSTNTLYYYLAYDKAQTQYATLKDALNQALVDGYIEYDVNNYICFGSNANPCPDENLYRIIGVFNNNGEEQVKLIKGDFAIDEMLGSGTANGSLSMPSDFYPYYKASSPTIPLHYWSGSSSSTSNTWSSSTLNTTALNANYMTYLGSDWTEMIAETTWKVGGNTWANIAETNAKTAYTREIVSPAESTTYEDEIGLMYVSDYYYAASPEYWGLMGTDFYDCGPNESTCINDYREAINENWMYTGVSEWTITRVFDSQNSSYILWDLGYLDTIYVNVNSSGVRPVFYLKSAVKMVGGNGTKSDPYRVN